MKTRGKVIDFNGMVFQNENIMCTYYGQDYELYKRRMFNGWSQKDALTIPSCGKLKKMLLALMEFYMKVLMICVGHSKSIQGHIVGA